MPSPSPARCCAFVFALLLPLGAQADEPSPQFRSHPPMRPLPVAAERPRGAGPALFVDALRGDDAGDGSETRPWRTLGHAAARLRAGDTLYLRGGTYYEHVTVQARGTAKQPVTIRAYPGELAILDGGLREFFENPAAAWEPVVDGADGEFRSVKTYPGLGTRPEATNVLGNFGDSMVPLHGYRFLSDLRSDNEYFAAFEGEKTRPGSGIYCGPGVFYDVETGRIHVRLAHMRQKALGEDNYRGETDPRKLPLVIAGEGQGSPLTIDGARYLRVADLVVRGSRLPTLVVTDSANIVLDGVTAYGGAAPIQVRDTAGLSVLHCACRGIAAPWTFRGHLKYRAIEARLFSASGWDPTGADNRDFEIAYSEFTDSVDGVFLGNVRRVRFHHNLLDNVSDDGLFVTATTAPDGTTHGGDVYVYQNLLARCLTTFAFGVGHGRQKALAFGKQTGSGLFIARNVFDFRRPVHYQHPAEGVAEIASYGRVAGDHGGPTWEPMTIYHNTVVSRGQAFRGYYGAGLGGHMGGGARRRVFNNAFVQVEGAPGDVLPEVAVPGRKRAAKRQGGGSAVALREGKASERVDFVADGNLHWSYRDPPDAGVFLKRFRNSPRFEASRELYPAGWTRSDVAADPQFAAFDESWREPIDLRLSSRSAAVDAGVKLPREWPDPLRPLDEGRPDIGAVPRGVEPWRVGVRGRLTIFGGQTHGEPLELASAATFPLPADQLPKPADGKPAVIVSGYPAFDAPLLEYSLKKQGVSVETLERAWLPVGEYDKYALVAIVGNLARAKIEPHTFRPQDLPRLRAFLEAGGTLLLMRGTTAAFRTPEGRRFLAELTAAPAVTRKGEGALRVLTPDHRWVQHLAAGADRGWLSRSEPLSAGRGEIIIGDGSGRACLYRLPVGRGELVYVGWEIAHSLPHGRKPSTVEQEAAFEAQMEILQRIVGPNDVE